MPDIKLVEEKETINCENRLEDRKEDNIILCELTEEIDSHEKAEKSINTVFPTKIVHDAIKEEGIDEKSSEEMTNRLGDHSATEHTEQWTTAKEHTYPSNYSENLFNCLGGVKSRGVEGKGGYLQWTRIADNHEVQSNKGEKLLIHCNFMERNLHSVNMELYVQRKDQLDERKGSENRLILSIRYSAIIVWTINSSQH